MNDSLNQWLDRCARGPGVLGCGVRRPDGVCASASVNEACPCKMVDDLLICLADCLPAFSTRGFIPNQLKWTFAKGQLLLVNRPDGILLGMILQPDSPVTRNLEALAGEFLALEIAR